MKLTDNCRNEFQIWAISQEELKFKNILGLFCINIYGFWIPFYLIPTSMQYGVYVDFFDSVGMRVNVGGTSFSNSFVWHVSEVSNPWGGKCKTRKEARTKAIEKANEIYNGEKA